MPSYRGSILCVIVCLLLGAPAWSQMDFVTADATSRDSVTGGATAPGISADSEPIKEALSVSWLYGPYVRKGAVLDPLTMPQRQKLFLKQTFTTPGIYMRSGFLALLDQAKGTPYQWRGGFDGYERRYGSYWARTAIQNALSSAGNAALRYEPRYDRCRCSGFKARSKHALLRNLVTYDETETTLHPQFALYGGTFGAGMIASHWQARGKPLREGYHNVLSQLGLGMVSNWMAEFAPEIRRKIKLHRG